MKQDNLQPGSAAVVREQPKQSNLVRLQEEIRRTCGIAFGVVDCFRKLRSDYIATALDDQTRKLLAKIEVDVPVAPCLSRKVLHKMQRLQVDRSHDWSDWHFHVAHRVTKRALRVLEEEAPVSAHIGDLRIALNKGYLLSVLPLNLLLPKEVLSQFLPPKDFGDRGPTKCGDPYGIFSNESTIVKHGCLLGSSHFSQSVLVNIGGFCPIGCSDCYKSPITREITRKKAEKKLGLRLVPIDDHFRELVAYLNQNPSVTDVIISGGEPLMMSNRQLKRILTQLCAAKTLRTLRICTGCIFLGLPFRIDGELIGLLREFQDATGTTVTLQAHLSNHHQITPEAIIAVRKVVTRGINIYTQVPIRRGINFFPEDPDKTHEYLAKLGRMQVSIGVQPYVFLADMHPRTNAYYVPIEPLIKAWAELVESHRYPGLERPRSLSILHRRRNIILSGHTLFAMRKEVDEDEGVVRYFIPAPSFVTSGGTKSHYYMYEEPLMEENRDPKSLERLRDSWFS